MKDLEIHTLKGEVSFSITEVCEQTNKTMWDHTVSELGFSLLEDAQPAISN
jgi:hypothetical protein